MDDIEELYMELLVEHSNSKVNTGTIHGKIYATVEAFNPICGDKIVFRVCDDDQSYIAKYECAGCAISKASASMAAKAINESKSKSEAILVLNQALNFTLGLIKEAPSTGDWSALGGVAKFPMRVKCATMSIRAALAALDLKPGEILESDE